MTASTKKALLDQHRTHWQWYREFFSVAILRYFVIWFSIVPLALHVFQAVPAEVHWGGWSIDFRPSLPFSWTILWFASLAYTAALVIFTVRCPEFIKKYPTYSHYKAYGHSPRWLVWLTFDVMNKRGAPWEKLFGRLNAKNYLDVSERSGALPAEPEVLDYGTVLSFKRDGTRYEFVMPRGAPGDTEIAEQEIFWEIFGAHSGGQRVWRAIIIGLLVVALVLFSIVLVQHISAALPTALGNLLETLFGMWGWLMGRVSML